MIHLSQAGSYELVETPQQDKILYLDRQRYIWLKPKKVSEIMLVNRRRQVSDTVLSLGQYRYFEVENEPYLTDGYHLELETGMALWQGYIIDGGLPDKKHKMSNVVPTHELISGEHKLWSAYELTSGHKTDSTPMNRPLSMAKTRPQQH